MTLASAKSGEQVPSDETFFLIKMGQVPGLTSSKDKYRLYTGYIYRSQTVYCGNIWGRMELQKKPQHFLLTTFTFHRP